MTDINIYKNIYQHWLNQVSADETGKNVVNAKKYLDPLFSGNVISNQEKELVEKGGNMNEKLYLQVMAGKSVGGFSAMLGQLKDESIRDSLIKCAISEYNVETRRHQQVGNGQQLSMDTTLIKTIKAAPTFGENGSYTCVDGIRNCPKHKPPVNDQQLSRKKLNQLATFEGIRAEERMKNMVGRRTFEKTAGDCSRYLSNHEDLLKIAKLCGCETIAVNVTPKLGSFWAEVRVAIVGIGQAILELQEFRELLLTTLQNIINGIVPAARQLVAFLGTGAGCLTFAIVLCAFVGLACLAYGFYYGDNRAIIIGSAFTTAAAGAAIGAGVGSVVPALGTAIGGAVGFVGGLVGGTVLGVIAAQNA